MTVTEVVCVQNFLNMRSEGNIELNPSKVNRNKVHIFYSIVFILVANCSFHYIDNAFIFIARDENEQKGPKDENQSQSRDFLNFINRCFLDFFGGMCRT